jgi:hypothetical protein
MSDYSDLLPSQAPLPRKPLDGRLVAAAVVLALALGGGWYAVSRGLPSIGVAPGPIRVLITYDPKGDIPESQQSLIESATLREYLTTHCEKSGDRPEWRIVPNTAKFESDQPKWQALAALPRKSEPAITIERGTKRISGDLPLTEPAAMKLLTTYGGK